MTRLNTSTTVPDTRATTLATHKATVVTSTSLTTLMLHCTPITNSYFVHAPPNTLHPTSTMGFTVPALSTTPVLTLTITANYFTPTPMSTTASTCSPRPLGDQIQEGVPHCALTSTPFTSAP